MGFKIDGVEWKPQTTDEHATQWIEGVNELLEQNNIKDENGNIIKLSQNFANAMYLQILAGANRLSANDKKLSAGIDSLNVETCDDEQIENLLPIAAITRNTGSYSTIILTVKASDDNACTIPAGTKAPYGDVNFVVDTTAVVEAGTTQNIQATCDTVGPVVVLKGEITSFDTQIANLESVINNVSSVPGNAAETTTELRRRILRGNTIPYSIDGVKIALEELSGVNNAKVFFNYNTSSEEEISGGIILQPRTAYIVINGTSAEIAQTYFKYMSSPTQNAPGASSTGTKTTVACTATAGVDGATVPEGTSFSFNGMTFESDSEVVIAANSSATVNFTAIDVGAVVIPSGAITSWDEDIDGVTAITNSASVPGVPKTAYTQDYITQSGQSIPVHYDKAQDETIFVKVWVNKSSEGLQDQVINQIKRDLIGASASWGIGENITSLVTSVPFADCTYASIAYTEVSTDGETWSNIVSVPANSIPRINDDTIDVEELS